MHRSKDMPEYAPNLDDVYMDIVLEAGDVLYLPRGWCTILFLLEKKLCI